MLDPETLSLNPKALTLNPFAFDSVVLPQMFCLLSKFLCVVDKIGVSDIALGLVVGKILSRAV